MTVELPFDERFSGPPTLFPASMVGTAGDVAAVASCLTLMPKGWAVATLDFTIKMTGVAKGETLRAKGRVLQDGRTNSIGAADVYSRIRWHRALVRNRACHDPQLQDQVACAELSVLGSRGDPPSHAGGRHVEIIFFRYPRRPRRRARIRAERSPNPAARCRWNRTA